MCDDVYNICNNANINVKSDAKYIVVKKLDKKSDKNLDVKLDINSDVKSDSKIIVKKQDIIDKRRKRLFNELSMLKLDYVRGGICDSYIKFGHPPIEDVIKYMTMSTQEEEQRLEKLLEILKSNNILYDSRVSYYKEYVEQGTDLDTAIIEGKKEWFYINLTEYNDILKKYKDEEKSMKIALRRYVRKNGYDYNFYKFLDEKEIRTIKSESKIRIY